MATGIVSYYDDNIGQGRIETSSGHFAVRADDMAPDARTQGARVDFDVVREEPHDRAVNVRLRLGTRNDPKQRRFGDTG
ncbi:MAG TPA: hypothetical protein VG452_09215 [Egibacteraceae bacterium]|nr:hypothetical protein [Egibacteraceae bacterium]